MWKSMAQLPVVIIRVGKSGQVGRQVAYSSDLGHLLGLGREWAEEAAEEQDDGEGRCERSADDHHAAPPCAG
jgi:hypothetical protein